MYSNYREEIVVRYGHFAYLVYDLLSRCLLYRFTLFTQFIISFYSSVILLIMHSSAGNGGVICIPVYHSIYTLCAFLFINFIFCSLVFCLPIFTSHSPTLTPSCLMPVTILVFSNDNGNSNMTGFNDWICKIKFKKCLKVLMCISSAIDVSSVKKLFYLLNLLN